MTLLCFLDIVVELYVVCCRLLIPADDELQLINLDPFDFIIACLRTPIVLKIGSSDSSCINAQVPVHEYIIIL